MTLVLKAIKEINRLKDLAKEGKRVEAKEIDLDLFSSLVDELVKMKVDRIVDLKLDEIFKKVG